MSVEHDDSGDAALASLRAAFAGLLAKAEEVRIEAHGTVETEYLKLRARLTGQLDAIAASLRGERPH